MLERSANKGYHIAFRRKPNLSQEDNLKWAAKLLGVEYDKGAKDITRVFYTPPTDRLLYFDKELLDNTECKIQIQESEISKVDSCNTQKEQKAEDEAVEKPQKNLTTVLLNTAASLMQTSSANGGRCITTDMSLFSQIVTR